MEHGLISLACFSVPLCCLPAVDLFDLWGVWYCKLIAALCESAVSWSEPALEFTVSAVGLASDCCWFKGKYIRRIMSVDRMDVFGSFSYVLHKQTVRTHSGLPKAQKQVISRGWNVTKCSCDMSMNEINVPSFQESSCFLLFLSFLAVKCLFLECMFCAACHFACKSLQILDNHIHWCLVKIKMDMLFFIFEIDLCIFYSMVCHKIYKYLKL